MSEILALRPYQAEAVQAVRKAWHRGVRRPAVVLPTGSGKTVLFAHAASQMHERGVRTLILAHRDELIEQAADKLRRVAPDLKIGIVKGPRREIGGSDVIVASVQSLIAQGRRDELKAAGVRLVIADEAHHGPATSWMNVFRDLGCFDDRGLEYGAAALGVTATLTRSDKVALDQVWQEVVYRRDILEMIKDGYLVNVKGVRVKIDGLDLSKVKRSRGDFSDSALATALHDTLAPKAVARAYVEHARDRQGILFAPTVESAYEMSEALNSEGIVTEAVDGAMPLQSRRDILTRFARGDTRVVANCQVLTEGFDAPWCSCVVIARPTSSVGLFVQMSGRCLRPHPGKRDALILDVTGVSTRHKLASVVDLAGAERVEKLPAELAGYDEVDLLGLDELTASQAAAFPLSPGHDGPLVHEIVDLFGTSRQAWLRTERGVWFLDCTEHLIFLAPGAEAGRYDVCRAPKKTRSGEFLQRDVDLEMAMSWGEQYAAGTYASNRSASWRRGQPSEKQITAATRMQITADGLTKGQLSDAMSRFIASRRLDGMALVRTVSERGYW